MKQLLSLFLFLLPCLALAQYPSNGNQKITLGEQSTADGLVYRGVLADTGIITPSSDTSAYIILDTVNHRFYNYNRATNVWSMAGVGSISSGLTGTLPVANGGTGITSLGTGVATFLGTPSSANLASAVTNETGSGNLVFATQPVFTNTVGIGGETASTSGSGITFPATQSASTNANTLDDYEEGTWTPIVIGNTSTSGQTYEYQTGRYIKIGRNVYCTFELQLTAAGTVSGISAIAGLPFATSGTGTKLDAGGLVFSFYNNLNSNQIVLSGYAIDNESKMFITSVSSAGVITNNITITDLIKNNTRLAGFMNFYSQN
jgi:hypothetical protein